MLSVENCLKSNWFILFVVVITSPSPAAVVVLFTTINDLITQFLNLFLSLALSVLPTQSYSDFQTDFSNRR